MNQSTACCANVRRRRNGDAIDARVDQSEIAALYDKRAALYDVWGNLTESRARARAIELAHIRNGQTIAEVAVGTGLAFREIVSRNPDGRNIGIDLSPGMLREAEKKLQALPPGDHHLKVGSAFNLELDDDSVDTLVNNYMFDLIPFEDMDRVIREFRRVLRPGGKLVLVNMTRGETRASRLYDTIYRFSPAAMGGCRGVRMAEKLEQQGFQVGCREYHQQMLFPSEVVIADQKPF